MKKSLLIIGIAAIALVAAVMGKLLAKEPYAQPTEEPLVEIAKAQIRDIILNSELSGTIEPESIVYIYPKAAGEVKELFIKAGDRVEKDQLLCVIDTKQVDSAKSTLDSAELMLRQAQDELSRQTILYDGGGISQQEYQKYIDNVTSAKITRDNAKVNYVNQVSYSNIKTPIAGIIEECGMQVYDSVASSNLLCVISGEGSKVVSFYVTERIKNNLQEGGRIQVEKDGAMYSGSIYEINTKADGNTGLFHIKARLDDILAQEIFSTGSVVKLEVISDSAEHVTAVPLDSIYYDGGISYVFVYDRENSCLHKTQVETGLYDSLWIEIQKGLESETEVLTTWSSELHDGAAVRVKEE